jgi:hypothetical protein
MLPYRCRACCEEPEEDCPPFDGDPVSLGSEFLSLKKSPLPFTPAP